MSHDTSVCTPALLPVAFHDATLYLVNHQGEPYVPMRRLVEAMGLAWQGQFDKIKARYESTVMEIMTVAEDGKARAMTCLPLRKLPGWLMTIHPNKVNPALRARVQAFQEQCDDVLWAYWSGQRPASPTFALNVTALPGDPLTKEVRAAINRRAHALSLRHFDRIREDLTAAVRRHHERFPQDRDLVAFVEDVDTPDSALVCVHRSDLWAVTSGAMAIPVLFEMVAERIHALEAETGMAWYPHGKPGGGHGHA